MPGHEDNGGGWGVLAGAGVALTQLFVLLPGLFAVVALTAVFLIPFALPLIPIAILAGAFVAIRAVWRALLRLARNGGPQMKT